MKKKNVTEQCMLFWEQEMQSVRRDYKCLAPSQARKRIEDACQSRIVWTALLPLGICCCHNHSTLMFASHGSRIGLVKVIQGYRLTIIFQCAIYINQGRGQKVNQIEQIVLQVSFNRLLI
ncbi:hypothetical protein VNO80_09528 [Phaseolus coccineus]|uniref:Uncharacterized protein n=1 Tax=Phaseolus coccineus TaxID=3886 RepID=A0AAN9N6C4_PHACN